MVDEEIINPDLNKLSLFLNNLNYKLDYLAETQELILQAMINRKQSATISKEGSVDKHLRNIILIKQNYKCRNCGLYDSSGKKLHIDHILPRSEGGLSKESNLQILCNKCNLIKKNYIFDKRGYGSTVLNDLYPQNNTQEQPQASESKHNSSYTDKDKEES